MVMHGSKAEGRTLVAENLEVNSISLDHGQVSIVVLSADN